MQYYAHAKTQDVVVENIILKFHSSTSLFLKKIMLPSDGVEEFYNRMF